MYGSLCCPSVYLTWSHVRYVWVLVGPSFYVAWSHFRSVWVTLLTEFLCRLVSLPFCMSHSVDRGSMSFGRTFVMYGPYVLRVSMSFGLTFVLMGLYVVWLSMSHMVSLSSVWVSMFSEFLCHLVSLLFWMGLYVVRVSMSLGLTSVLNGSLCCSSFNVAWFHIRSVWVLVLSESLCRLVSVPFCIGLYVVRVSLSLGLTSVLYGSLCVRVSMSLGFTSVLCGSLCCPSFNVTFSHFRYVLVSMMSEFLCHLVSLPLCTGVYGLRVSVTWSLVFGSILPLC